MIEFDIFPHTETAEIETGLLGCLIHNPSFINQLEDISEEDFQYESTAKLFSALKAMYAEKLIPDRYAIKQRFLEENEDGAKLIEAAIAFTPTLTRFETYMKLVKEASTRRKLIKRSLELVNALKENVPLEDVYAYFTDCLKEAEIKSGRDTITFAQGYDQFLSQRGKPKEYITTGYPGLDKMLKISKGDYIVIGGRPSSGKTAFSLELALRFAEKHKVVYFSYETSAEKIMDRAITASAEVNFAKLQSGTLEAFENDRIDGLNFRKHKIDLHIVEASGRSVDWMTRKALQLEADIVFVDYLGLVKCNGKTPYERTTQTSMQLHSMAQQRKMTVVALSQLSREGDKGIPTLTNLRESGQIEQDADAVILLQKGEEILNHGVDPSGQFREKVILAKNKTGHTGVKDYIFIGYHQRFEETA